MGKSVREPIEPTDIFTMAGIKPVTTNMFGKSTTKETTGQHSFSAKDYDYLTNPTPYDDVEGLQKRNVYQQPVGDMLGNTALQFGTNLVSSFGQGLANTFDLYSNAKTAKGIIDGSVDNFESKLFGLTNREMQEWANGIAQRNPILEKEEGSVNLADLGWWAKQVASSGTGVGMALEALATTVAIEYATGGMGTAAALAKLGNLGKKIISGKKGAEVLSDAVSAAKGMKSAATVYGTMSRVSESRMEAMSSYDEIYEELSNITTKDSQGNTIPKYSEEEKEKMASAGARITYGGNMALLPLDILSFRAMVYNPISGAGVGLLERGLSKIGNKAVSKGLGYTIGVVSEGAEEGSQFIMAEEGKNYARTLAGLSNGDDFLQRLGKNVETDEFWNNVAGGIIGSPIIGGTMNVANKLMHGNKAARINEIHKNYMQNVGKMDNTLAKKIVELETTGKTREASIARRQFNANRSLGALHYDAIADRDTAFDAHLTFIATTLGELNAGKIDALTDLGFNNPTPQQIQVVKEEFEQYQKDAIQMKEIYDKIKVKYNKSFVPAITQDHFHLQKLMEEEKDVDGEILAVRNTLFQYDTLTSFGKELYDSEYRLQVLQEEKKRLSNQYRETNNSKEKENIAKLLENNEIKITQTKNRVQEISKDSSYSTLDKYKDGSILNSSLKDRNYLQVMYDKEHLDNEINLQRENIALWNNAEYAKEKTKELVKNAKTRQQAEDAAANTESEDIKAEAEKKKQEIAAAEAAEAIRLQNEAAKAKTNLHNDDPLFKESDDALNALGNVVTTPIVTPVVDNGQVDGRTDGDEIEALFSPADYDIENANDEVKEGVKNSVKKLIDRAGGNNIFFEDLVRHAIKIQGIDAADRLYHLLKYGWEANGKKIEDYDAIYSKIFGNPMDELIALESQLNLKTSEQFTEATKKVEEDVLSHEENKPEFDNNNQPKYTYTGVITNESSPKAAFSTRLTYLVRNENEDGTVDISYEYGEDNINPTNKWVDSNILLDPDKVKGREETEIRIPDDFNDIPIAVYSETENTKYIPFGQYVAEKGLTPQDQEYKDKIPMVHYLKGVDNGGKGIFFVHDTQWYHPARFNQEFADDMSKAIASTREIRDEVLANHINGKGTSATITSKRQTTFEGLKTPLLGDGTTNRQLITLQEANPQTKLTIAASSDTLTDDKDGGKVLFQDGKKVLINTKFGWTKGQIIEVRRFGLKDGAETYIANPIFRDKLDEESRLSVLQAINIYGHRAISKNTPNPKHDAVVKHIKDTMGLDILSEAGFQKYIKHFINVFNTDKAKTNADVEAQAKAKLAPGTPYIAIIAGGNIVFGKAGEPLYFDSNKNAPVNSNFINPNSTFNPNTALANISKYGIIGWFEQNLDLTNLHSSANKPIVTIARDYTTNVAAPSYNDFLLSKLKTNMRSHNIGTAEKPNYVTNIQPVVTYDTNTRLQKQSAPKTNAEVREEMVQSNAANTQTAIGTVDNKNENIEVQEKIEQLDINEAIRLAEEAVAKAKAKLGIDYKNNSDDVQFSPTELSDDERNSVSAFVNNIAGLTDAQQFDITDFMYNQITAMVNLDNKQVTRAEVDKEVEKAFKEVIEPQKKEIQELLKRDQDLIAQFSQLKDHEIAKNIPNYEFRLAKIKALEDGMDVLKQEAYNRVAKYTGITESKVKFEAKEEAENLLDSDDDGAENNIDFWTDILTESPENKLTYSMRRFFGQVRNVSKDGTLITGFLGVPTYVGADTIIKQLMVTLADVPSSFDAMIAKLEKRKEGLPWMQQVIDKLKAADNQKQKSFVTVMSNTMLRMKFTMISYNRKTGNYTTKVYDTNSSGISSAIEDEWQSNFIDSDLVILDEEKNYILNNEKAQSLLSTFESWKGNDLKVLDQALIAPLWDTTISKVTRDKSITFTPTGNLLQQLRTNLVSKTDRMKFTLKGNNFQVTTLGNGQYKIEQLKETVADKNEVKKWLSEFGIIVSDETINELYNKGLYHNYARRSWTSLFESGTNTNGLFGILYEKLKGLASRENLPLFNEEGGKPLDDTVLSSLATLESKFNSTTMAIGFRDGGKSIYAISAPKFITDRFRDLKNPDNLTIIEQLNQISFSRPSLWLKLLNSNKFKDKFNISHIGLTAFKQLGVKAYRDNSINKLSDTDHELTKLGMFWDTTQGELETAYKKYESTDVEMRMATMFSPTMSDKSMMTLITTAVLNLQNTDLMNGEALSEQVVKIIYEQTVKPELLRMIKFHQNGSKTNISGYDKGAGMFLLLPEMNNLELTPELKLVDAIREQSNTFNIQELEKNEELMNEIHDVIQEYVYRLTQEKLKVWETNGFIGKTETGETDLKYFDGKYLTKFHGTKEEQAKMAAMDFVVNSMISNANSFMLLAGDPALYYKSKAKDALTQAKDTFVNVGKRLANQIAPGTTLAESEHGKYRQVFIADRKSISENIDYLERLYGKEGAASYRDIEGSDAQEYTTWKEHLDILTMLGKTPDSLQDITPDEIQEARELMSSNPDAKLTDKQKALLGKVMQPIKPVYTGQIYDKVQDVMRTVYIKTSSFPLIPQLTAGFEIDKLRVALEKLEKDGGMPVRASYQTGNKVGSVNNPAIIWNNDGTINQEALTNIESSSLVLDRKNFRIQQEVPFKSGKKVEDTITLMTQMMKLLFGDEVINYDGFTYQGKSYNGRELHSLYNTAFIELVQTKQRQLYNELGLDENGVPKNSDIAREKLQKILKDEAISRGYPLQDIEGLKMVNGEFNLPLWSSSNSNRYESMLNAIVSNRLIKMKFPGNSYVVGSEEGFTIAKKEEGDLTKEEKSKIIFTSAWNGSHLTASYTKDENGNTRVVKAQVFVASKFRDNNGKIIDLMTKENGQYKYITEKNGSLFLKDEMFDKDLLALFSARIPSSGLQSGSQIEIAGFLPHQNADLMIVPRNFTKQKGLDFDVDKENSYQYWHYLNADGKFEILNESHRSEILTKIETDKKDNKKLQELLAKLKKEKEEGAGPIAIKKIKDEIRIALAGQDLINKLLGDVEYTEEDIEDAGLTKLNSKINEKLLQNKIVAMHNSVYSNPAIQHKISKTLNTDYTETQAEFIDGILNSTKDEQYWTPLSDEYQKQKLMLGSSGKIGTGAYSLDVVGHSLFQQVKLNGKPLTFNEKYINQDDGKTYTRRKIWTFGRISSTGELGGTNTLGVNGKPGDRTISEVMGERQNVAVDNEKLQIMGRVNLNDITMDVDKVFNMLGFDKGEDGNSISFLFLSQPIIKEYVAAMRNADSNIAEFSSNKEKTIVDNLIAKYLEEAEKLDEDTASFAMNNETLISNLTNPNGQLQVAVLERFMEMKTYGIALRGIQTTINTDSKGLGKSFFDVIEKRAALNRLGTSGGIIEGASNLLGNYVFKADNSNKIDSLLEEGYIDIGNYLVKPTTLSGAFNILGVNTAYNLWQDYFPYDAAVTQMVFDEILPLITTGDISDSAKIEKKQEIFKHMKKYFNTFKQNGIIKESDDINQERKRLFIDSSDNISLAKYIHTIKNMNDPAVNQFIKTNKLFNRFEFDLQKDGQPSKIKFNNAAGEEFDEQYLYKALASLITVRGQNGKIQLPTVGNKSYTLDTLAQDMIAYSMLGNSTQEAIQFTKYVPVSYLDAVGYSSKMRLVTRGLNTHPSILGVRRSAEEIRDKINQHLLGEFSLQFIQHNPERLNAANKLNPKELSNLIINATYSDGKRDLNNLQSFKMKDSDKNTPFKSIYNSAIPKGEKKQQLYILNAQTGVYNRIAVLGTFGMDEYQKRASNGIGESLVNGRVRTPINAAAPAVNTPPKVEEQIDFFNISSGSAAETLKNISESNLGKYSSLAQELLPFVNNGITIKYETEIHSNGKTVTNFYGVYNKNTNTISINNLKLAGLNNEKKAQTVLEEIVHALTVNQIQPFIKTNQDGSVEVLANVPTYVTNIVRLYNEVRNTYGFNKGNTIINQVKNNEGLKNVQDRIEYSISDIYEFMARAISNHEFQRFLATEPYKQSGKTLLEKFKEVIFDVLKSIGVNFEANTATAEAINSIFEFIEAANNPKPIEVTKEFSEDDRIDAFLNRLDNELQSGEPEIQLNPSFPQKQLNIKNEKCI